MVSYSWGSGRGGVAIGQELLVSAEVSSGGVKLTAVWLYNSVNILKTTKLYQRTDV